MKSVYIVQHSYDVGEDEQYTETKIIGIYSSLEKAEIKNLRFLEQNQLFY